MVAVSLRRTVRTALALAVASVAAIGALIVGTGTASAALSPGELRAVTDNYIFSHSLSGFISIRAQRPYANQLTWSSDACSNAPDNPFGFEFKDACYRHDFGYRNYKRQGRFTEGNRLALDNRFKSDMYSMCGGSWWCERTADVYYQAVRQFGGNSTGTAGTGAVLDRPEVRAALKQLAQRHAMATAR